MQFEVIGAVTLLVAACTLWLGPAFGIYATAIASIFGAAAAVKLPSLGDASIPPAPILAGFFALSIAMHPRLRNESLQHLHFPRAGFWLMALTAYAIVTAFFLPRIFENMSNVYLLARNAEDVRVVSLPIAPRPSNLTQAAYVLINLICFACVAGYAARGGMRTIARAILTASGLMIFFAAADLLTHLTGTADLLSVIRNANYRILGEGEIGGFKRIVGSFSEAGAYSYAALGCYAFALSLWLDGSAPRITGVLALALGLTLVFSTSSTAYFTLVIHTMLILAVCARSLCRGGASPRQLGLMLTFPALLLLLLALAMLEPPIWNKGLQLFDATISNKLETQSGVERLRWNEHAYRTFIDTSGWGAGTGSVRASSLVFAALANVGVVGLLLLAAFIVSALLPGRRLQSADDGIGRAAAHAGFVLTVAACISAGTIDLGLMFSVFAALSVSSRRPIDARAVARRFDLRPIHMAAPLVVSTPLRIADTRIGP
jgi:hypothetical protein